MSNSQESAKPDADPSQAVAKDGLPIPHAEATQDEETQREVKDRSAPDGHVVYGAIENEGISELRRSNSALAWSGLAAGLSMGFSVVMPAVLASHLPVAPWRPLITKMGYSVGFLIVILARQQLFTENTLTVILPLLRRPTRKVLLSVLRLWGVVLLTNLVGALLFALVIAHTNTLDSAVREEFKHLGLEALEPGFGTVLIRGIFAGWLIALMVWLLPFAETARIWVILLITYAVGLGSFSHVIVGSVETLYLWVTGVCSLGGYVGSFLVPALLGNVIGGVSLVAALAHAQFVATEQEA